MRPKPFRSTSRRQRSCHSLAVIVVLIIAFTGHRRSFAASPTNARESEGIVYVVHGANTRPPGSGKNANTAARDTPAPSRLSRGRTRRVLGTSTQGWPIESYRLGQGPIRVAFIGGIHGGLEWNTIRLAYQAIDYFSSNFRQLPDSISLYIVPSANPDGQVAVVGHTGRFSPADVVSSTVQGRFNGNGVDLNRNWDCDWTRTGYWLDREVDAGAAPFSEVESRILRRFLTTPPMDAVIFWHSASPGVFIGRCDAPLPQAIELAAVYADAAQYPLFEQFNAYSITGDATDWLSSQGIPAIVVELSNRADTDWSQNLAGMRAVLSHLSSSSGPLRSNSGQSETHTTPVLTRPPVPANPPDPPARVRFAPIEHAWRGPQPR